MKQHFLFTVKVTYSEPAEQSVNIRELPVNALSYIYESARPRTETPSLLTVKVFVIVLCFLPLLAWAEAEAKAEPDQEEDGGESQLADMASQDREKESNHSPDSHSCTVKLFN